MSCAGAQFGAAHDRDRHRPGLRGRAREGRADRESEQHEGRDEHERGGSPPASGAEIHLRPIGRRAGRVESGRVQAAARGLPSVRPCAGGGARRAYPPKARTRAPMGPSRGRDPRDQGPSTSLRAMPAVAATNDAAVRSAVAGGAFLVTTTRWLRSLSAERRPLGSVEAEAECTWRTTDVGTSRWSHPARAPAPGELDVLGVEEEALVEPPDLAEVVGAQEHRGAAPREDVLVCVVLAGVALEPAAVGRVAVGDELGADVVHDVERLVRERHLEPRGVGADR